MFVEYSVGKDVLDPPVSGLQVDCYGRRSPSSVSFACIASSALRLLAFRLLRSPTMLARSAAVRTIAQRATSKRTMSSAPKMHKAKDLWPELQKTRPVDPHPHVRRCSRSNTCLLNTKFLYSLIGFCRDFSYSILTYLSIRLFFLMHSLFSSLRMTGSRPVSPSQRL